jgi:hypothetical protein
VGDHPGRTGRPGLALTREVRVDGPAIIARPAFLLAAWFDTAPAMSPTPALLNTHRVIIPRTDHCSRFDMPAGVSALGCRSTYTTAPVCLISVIRALERVRLDLFAAVAWFDDALGEFAVPDLAGSGHPRCCHVLRNTLIWLDRVLWINCTKSGNTH